MSENKGPGQIYAYDVHGNKEAKLIRKRSRVELIAGLDSTE